MKFAVLSDTHYISRRVIADQNDKELMLQPAVSEQAVLFSSDNREKVVREEKILGTEK